MRRVGRCALICLLVGGEGEGRRVAARPRAPVVAAPPAGSVAASEPRPLPALRAARVRWREVTVRAGRPLHLRVEREGPRARITALHAHAGDLWGGSLSDGLHRRHGGRWSRVPLFDRRVSALTAGPDGALWVGTGGGLARVSRGASAPLRDPRGWFARHVNALTREGETLWVFVYPGAVAVRFARGRAVCYRYFGSHDGVEAVRGEIPWTKELGALARATVFARAADGDAAWLATSEGLVRVEGDRVGAFTELGGALPDRGVHDVVVRGDGAWALLWRAGIARVSRAGLDVWRVRWQSQPDGLVPFAGGWLLATDDRGLVRVEPRGGGLRVTAWGAREGVARGFVSAVAVDREGVWVGGAEGVSRVEDGERALATQGGSE